MHGRIFASYTNHFAPRTHHRVFHSTSAAATDNAKNARRLTHIDESGRPSMVDVSPKEPTKRTATARGRIYIPQVAYELITGTTGARDGDSDPGAARSGADAASPGAAAALEKAKRKARAKGDVLTVAQLAAIMGCKRTHELIPLCHPLQLSHIDVRLHPEIHPAASPTSQPHHEPRALRGDTKSASDPWGDARTPPSDGAEDPSPGRASSPAKDAIAAGAAGVYRYSVVCTATVTCDGKTGVEMEALTAVSVGLLTVWDMLKAVAGREMIIADIVVAEKHGGKSGDFVRGEGP